MTRTTYMQELMIRSQPYVAAEAVMRGFDGSFQRAIARLLIIDYNLGHSEAECIVQSFNENPGGCDFLAAAELIINSKIES